MVHVVALAQYAAVYSRSWAADGRNARVRLRVERDRHQQDKALLREELRIKDARMASIPAHRRPFYRPTERLAILEIKAARVGALVSGFPKKRNMLPGKCTGKAKRSAKLPVCLA
jgi:hypothetical protein